MTHYEMAEKLSEKMGVSLEKATEALEACDWELLDAALMLEKEQGTQGQKTWSSQGPEAAQTAEEKKQRARERRRGIAESLGDLVRGAFNLGNRNRFEVYRNEKQVLEIPVTVLVLLLIFAFWVCVPLLVIGLFAGYRYAFSGQELGRESVNSAMGKAAEVAEKVKEEVTGEH